MAEAQIKELRIKRGNIKRSLTNSESLLTSIDNNTELETLDLEERLKKHQDLWSEFEKIQSQLDAITDDTELEESERNNFEKRYFTISGKMKKLITKIPQMVFIPSMTNDSIAHSSTSSHPDNPHSILAAANNNQSEFTSTYKLPYLNLPKFSGSYETWLGFSDTFKALVDSRPNIQDIEKLYHLKSCLTADAAEVIASLETSADNYQVAWNLLKDRYENKKIIVESHAKSLIELPCVSKTFSIRALLDQTQKHIRALRALGESVDAWDTLLIIIIKGKLTYQLREKWEDSHGESTVPTMKDLLNFLQRRAQFEEIRSTQPKLENNLESRSENKRVFNNKFKKSVPQYAHHVSQFKLSCYYCKSEHAIYSCEKFLKLTVKERWEAVKRHSLCHNCFNPNHRASDCRGGPCKKCDKRHNTLLHAEKENVENSETSNNSKSNSCPVNLQVHVKTHDLLSTALVDIFDSQGKPHACRVLLDSGSQPNFITEKMSSKLNLYKYPVDIPVSSLNLNSTDITHSVIASFKSRVNKYGKRIEFFVTPHVTHNLPSMHINPEALQIPKTIKLADPEFQKPAEVDALIGVQLFYKLLCVGQIKIKGHDAVFQKTKLGWIVAGPLNPQNLNRGPLACHIAQVTNQSEFSELAQFWEIEQVPDIKHLSKEELECESHFTINTTRKDSGRYVVRLPFNEKKDDIGESYKIALRRFHALENKFAKNPVLKEQYSDFIQEYRDLGHMSLVNNEENSHRGFFLPHHAIIREDSLTTKIRVVFDGSAKSSTGISLNNALMVGPTIQDDLFTIYTRFRSFPYALTGDIEKMYRQIEVEKEDSFYQKILWRENPGEPIKIFRLNTVTYGTASAPFLATRVLAQLSDDESHSFPLAAQVLKRDLYVDDVVTGSNTLEEALAIRDDLIKLASAGGFTIRKWAANDPRLISGISDNSMTELLSLDASQTIKTLGIHWNPRQDMIIFTIKGRDTHPTFSNNQLTKRTILSEIAKLFDPLGLLSPIIAYAKMMIQRLWKAQIPWDDPVPQEIRLSWLEFTEQLPLLTKIKFDRCVISKDSRDIQIHGFCDASEKGYGACLYLRSTNSAGMHKSSLLCSKSRVAPVQTVSIPRLELCAALLLARLYTSTMKALQHLTISQSIFWSDSTVTLHWINASPHSLKTFVSNRVAQIQELTHPSQWNHVPTGENPADLSSRGQMPKEFISNTIWQRGPSWLQMEKNVWPQSKVIPNETGCTETRNFNVPQAVMHVTADEFNLLSRFSSFRTLKRVVGYCLRFLNNASKNSIRLSGNLSESELNTASDTIIKLTQATAFSKEIYSLSRHREIDNKSKILNLNPFVENGILRVGGRLTHSELPQDQKHPILLPRKHHVTDLIIREKHLDLKHAGVQATLYAIRERYWPIDGRNTIRRIIHHCVTCFRAKPRIPNYIMGNLPASRLTFTRPFVNVGIDYCGPFFIKERRYRNVKTVKSYVAVYVCMATKAVHLELVSDLTTESFIGSLKRFFARRGKSKTISSDNGTNFVGASRELKELYKLFRSNQHNETVEHFLQNQEIKWNFIPPRSPHFGGLWESVVKSFKRHFLRAVGSAVLTFEQLQTYVTEIEAILNSRPISPLSSDPNDLNPLTPGHFLIGGPINGLPHEDLTDIKPGRLSLWQHAQVMRQHFWCRWHKEYLNELTVRSKWHSKHPAVTIGTLVLLKDENTPPLQWNMGRIISAHPGPDNIVRVVTVKTTSGIFKRCIKKVCPLPLENFNEVHNECSVDNRMNN